jgi:hypothetical protein
VQNSDKLIGVSGGFRLKKAKAATLEASRLIFARSETCLTFVVKTNRLAVESAVLQGKNTRFARSRNRFKSRYLNFLTKTSDDAAEVRAGRTFAVARLCRSESL